MRDGDPLVAAYGFTKPPGCWSEEVTYRSVEPPADTISPLAVNVDWEALVERHGGDTGAAFEELGKLKDFFQT
jgi:hypothetical protein